jgi:polyferredoxin
MPIQIQANFESIISQKERKGRHGLGHASHETNATEGRKLVFFLLVVISISGLLLLSLLLLGIFLFGMKPSFLATFSILQFLAIIILVVIFTIL